jgi:hypothetical protein
MFADFSRWGTRPHTTSRPRRVIAALAAVTGGLLAWAAAVPAASAATTLIPDPGGAPGPAPAVPVQVIAVGGMPGWQITLIALGAALVAATVTVLLDRARIARRAASTTTA